MCARQATILEEGEFQPANGHEKKKKKCWDINFQTYEILLYRR